ncbi:MAG: hypothetical protein ACRECH_16785 [Nitrososphaerales archaeon]
MPQVQGSTRPNRVAILHGSKLPVASGDAHEFLLKLFSPLKINILSISSLGQHEKQDPDELLQYDVIGLVGAPGEFSFLHSFRPKGEGPVILAFAPRTKFSSAKSYLKISNAVVLCETSSTGWLYEIARVAFSFFESILVPSLLNIDVADVRNIARGIGLAFNEADDLPEDIVSKLPSSCVVARSALLHFSCTDDVKLREIYSISKTIALKQGVDLAENELETHKDAIKLFRRVNVKMGIRIRERNPSLAGHCLDPRTESSRISMTAILFGI